ncbi:MAG TPA: gamma-glutamylcyclotransferase family protein [Candidatus Sulfotelmatobacter sp.]|nr:gamma-glutamylcyclotransferase family protein [Candidatus Sulfotelmatobacter sp.]
MLYFAFASNLDPERMRRHCPGHHVVGLAALPDHRLGFPRYSPEWGGGISSPQLAHGESVWGMVYDLDEEDMRALDQLEGFRGPGDQHNVCDREIVTVDLTRPDDGSIPRRVRPWMYQARPSNASPPSRRYLDAILTGARHHRLPDEYVARLAMIEVAAEAAG